MSNGCIFCQIASGSLDTDFVYKDEQVMVIKDINPQAPVHLLVIPVHHYSNIVEASKDGDLMSVLIAQCSRFGQELGGVNGFRVVVNTGYNGGQTVDHLHFHVLAGRELQWPPG